MKIVVFWFKFHWNLSPRPQCSGICSDDGLLPNRRQVIIQTFDGLVHLHLNVTTVTSWWARWCLKTPSSRLLTQTFIQMQIKKTTKAPCHLPLWGEFTGGLWIPRTKVQWRLSEPQTYLHGMKCPINVIIVSIFHQLMDNMKIWSVLLRVGFQMIHLLSIRTQHLQIFSKEEFCAW